MAAPSRSATSGSSTVPAAYAETVTPSDATTFVATRGVYVGGAGNLAVTMAGDGAAVTFTAVPAGTLLPISVTQVRSTSTTATTINCLW